jgi:hypothetical protein
MKYKVQNVTMFIDTIQGDYTGDCYFYIPFHHVKFMTENCGMRINPEFHGSDSYEPIFFHDYGQIYMNLGTRQYYSTDPDLLIMYLSWLLSQKGPQEISVEYSNPFWAIHDFEHAQHDESGCTVYVDKHIELQRLKDAFELMKKEGFELTYELIQEVEEAYNGRFGTSESFEEYLESEEVEWE